MTKNLEKKSLWNEAKAMLLASFVALPIATNTLGYKRSDNLIQGAKSQEGKKIRAELVKESFQDRPLLSKAYFLGDYLAANRYLNQ